MKRRTKIVALDTVKAERAARDAWPALLQRQQRLRAEAQRQQQLLETELRAEYRHWLRSFRTAEAQRAFVLAVHARGCLTHGQRDALLREIGP